MAIGDMTFQDIRREIADQADVFVLKGTVSSGDSSASSIATNDLLIAENDQELSGAFIIMRDGTNKGENRLITDADLTASPPTATPHKAFSGAPGDDEFDVYRYNPESINRAILRAIRRALTLRVLTEVTVEGASGFTLAADTFEYDLPSDFIGIYEIWQETDTDVYDKYILPEYYRLVTGTDGDTDVEFDRRYFSIDAGKRVRIRGYKNITIDALVDDDTVEMDSEYLINRALSWILHRIPWGEQDSKAMQNKYVTANDWADAWERQVRTSVSRSRSA